MISEFARSTTRAAAATLAAESGRGRMRAWRVHGYGGPAELRLEAARVPPLRAPDQLLVRVRASSLNPIDVAMTRGYGAAALNAVRAFGGAAPGEELPLVCGRDLVGEVVRAGPAARLRRGQRVWAAIPPHAPGAHAEYALVRDSWAAAAPASLDDAQAGGAPYAALTAMAALRAAGLDGAAGAEVLLLGLGGVGQAALRLLAARGHRVTVGCAAELGELARRLGAAETLNRHDGDYEERLCRGGPYAAVLDCAGLGGEEAGARRWRFARYVTLTSPLLRETDARGVWAGGAAAAARLAAQNLAAGAGCAPRVRWAFFSASAADLEELRSLADRGRFGVAVERVFPWWSAPAAYRRAASGAARGKLVLDFTLPLPENFDPELLSSRPPEDST